MIERFALKNFTAFDRININFSPGINIIIGENGTGKSHLLKAAYALSSGGALKNDGAPVFEASLTGMLVDLFHPLGGNLSNLRKWGTDGKAVLAADFSAGRRVSAIFGEDSGTVSVMDDNYPKHYSDNPVYIQPRETLSFLKGFAGLYERYDIPFDRSFRNMALMLDLPRLRPEKTDDHSRRIMSAIEKVCGGQFVFHGGGRVSFRSGDEEFSASATAEGFLQLGTLYRLIENGSIKPGESGPIFWDEPETSLNPKLIKVLAGIMLELARNGQQIVIATHSYVLLKYLELLQERSKGDELRFHSLGRDDNRSVKLESVDNYNHMSTNPIIETYLNLYDSEVDRVFGKKSR